MSSSTTDDDSTMMIATTVVQDFCSKPTTTTASLKILQKLLSNAIMTDDPKFRTIKCTNPKIQSCVMQVDGAVNVLVLAGFVTNNNNQDNIPYLIYSPPNDEQLLSKAILQQLEEQLKQRQPQTTPIVPITTTTQNNNNNNGEEFLSNKERMERQKRAKEAKRIKEAERRLAQQRWEEDKLARSEAQKRKEALLKIQQQQEQNEHPAGVTIKTMASTATAAAAPVAAVPQRVIPGIFAPSPNDVTTTGGEQKQAGEDPPPPATSNDLDTMADNTEVMSTNISEANVKPLVAAAAKMEEEEDLDPDAKSANLRNDTLWNDALEDLPRCADAVGIRDTSIYHRSPAAHHSSSTAGTNNVGQCLKRLVQELKELAENLPAHRLSSIWLRFDADTPQYQRALITAPLGTPYAGGVFLLDIFIPNEYPNVPPKVTLLTTGGGRVRFGPNLYADGKVCLSLLGTWPGPRWSPKHSNLYQVLVSIQGLILGASQPYYLEPGHGGWEGDVDVGEDKPSKGHLLGTGQVVVETIATKQPLRVERYNHVLRVGTVRHAMLEALKMNNGYLLPFARMIQLHFFCNRDEILKEVQEWPNNLDESTDPQQASPHGSLTWSTLLPRLRTALSKVSHPLTGDATTSMDEDDDDLMADDDDDDDDTKLPPAQLKSEDEAEEDDMKIAPDALPPPKTVTAASKIEGIKTRMQEAANKGDYVLAGQLQEEWQQLDDLQTRMQQTASEGNFVRAGRLQEQLDALLSSSTTRKQKAYRYDASAQAENDDEMEIDEEQSDDDDDDDLDIPHMPVAGFFGGRGGGGRGFGGRGGRGFGGRGGRGRGRGHVLGGLQVGKHVFVPPGHPSHASFASASAFSGAGVALNSKTAAASKTTVASNVTMSNSAVIVKNRPIDPSACRLRIRLPNNESTMQDFDRQDKLAVVYEFVESILTCDGEEKQELEESEETASPFAAAPVRTKGAWAQQKSASGFTLLLTHPKKEFNLELHGAKSLRELGLVPSATLTVMKCTDRGVAYRGELESRLNGAQGNAMDVEGLTYEGLMELTERVGNAKPTAVTKDVLEANTCLLSPRMIQGDGARCQVCLSDYDPLDERKTLRKINRCGHVFHVACLDTWLGTKSCCPICKTWVASSEE